MFNPEFADAVESGDMFACNECHDFIGEFASFCPYCHVGSCERCGIPVTLENVGERDFIEPSLIWCKDCYAHDHGISTNQKPSLLATELSKLFQRSERC